ncbi:MAG: hypothetical protein LUQ35_02460, partial [Methanoregula sp.]|nr:hypothetical protein [Methanoregula sp.]
MKILPRLSPVLIAGIILCLVIVSGCTFPARTNSTPPTLITEVQTVSPVPLPSATLSGGAPSGGCSEGQTTCGGVCRNTLVDSSNCGRCGAACGSSQYCSNGACTSGTMVVPATSLTTGAPAAGVSCASGQTVCGGACRNTLVDVSNCGRCGNVCGASQTCRDGVCSSGTAPTTSTPVGVSCGTGLISCGGVCVNGHVRNNCGSCGNACGLYQDCYWSTHPDGVLFDIHCACFADSGLGFCEGSCMDFSYNNAHCGSCGNACL